MAAKQRQVWGREKVIREDRRAEGRRGGERRGERRGVLDLKQ